MTHKSPGWVSRSLFTPSACSCEAACGVRFSASLCRIHVSVRPVVWAYLAGVGANAIASARVGDLVRLYAVRRALPGAPLATFVSTPVAETVFGFVVIACLAGCYGPRPRSRCSRRLGSTTRSRPRASCPWSIRLLRRTVHARRCRRAAGSPRARAGRRRSLHADLAFSSTQAPRSSNLQQGPDALAPWSGFALFAGYAIVTRAVSAALLDRRDA